MRKMPAAKISLLIGFLLVLYSDLRCEEPTFHRGDTIYCRVNKLNVRTKPDANGSRVIGSMTKGDSATITGTIFVRGEVDGQSGLWYRVNTKAGVNGWVFGIYIQMEPVFVRQDGEVAVENWCLSKSGFETRLKTINDALADFRTLTDLLKENSNPKTDLNRGEIQRSTSPSYTFVIKQSDLLSLTQNAGLDWDIQHIGFFSWPEILQACEQALVLNNAELRLEIGKLKKATAEELGKLESTVEDERQKMVRFADQARPGE